MMYRTLNFGPNPVVNPATVDWSVNFSGAEPGSALSVSPKVPTAAPAAQAISCRLREAATMAIAAGTQVSFGIPFDGLHINKTNTLFQFTGTCTLFGDNGLILRAFVARANSGTLVTTTGASVNTCDKPDFIPSYGGIQPLAGGDYLTEKNVNTKLLVGPLGSSTAPGANPLIFGFNIANRSGATVTVEIEASMSGVRNIDSLASYEEDRG
ncbi:hypothetical protein [Microviridae sp.]|nr:hypothetical protein [Microviridae sp.]